MVMDILQMLKDYTHGCPQRGSFGARPFRKSVPQLEGLDYRETLSLVYGYGLMVLSDRGTSSIID